MGNKNQYDLRRAKYLHTILAPSLRDPDLQAIAVSLFVCEITGDMFSTSMEVPRGYTASGEVPAVVLNAMESVKERERLAARVESEIQTRVKAELDKLGVNNGKQGAVAGEGSERSGGEGVREASTLGGPKEPERNV